MTGNNLCCFHPLSDKIRRIIVIIQKQSTMEDFLSPQEKITFLVSSFGSRCFTQWCNFPRDKKFQICVLGNKFGLNLGLMWYFPWYIDLVLMVSLELSSINFTGWTCYNLLGNFLMEAIMGTLKVSSKPESQEKRKYSVKVVIAVDICVRIFVKCLLISDAAAAVADCRARGASLPSVRGLPRQWLDIIWLPER